MVDKSEKFTWLVRLGFAARGVVYILLGYLALSTAGKAASGQSAVFDMIQDVPLGTPLLYLVAIGLLAYAAFKLIDAAGDIDGHADDAAGRAKRVGSAASGLAHLTLAYAAYEFASGAKQRAAGEAGGQEAASGLLTLPLGWLLLAAVGACFIVAGLFQAKNAYDAHFMRKISGQAPAWVETVGRVGHGARAILFLIIGWSLIQSAWAVQTSEIKGLGAAIVALSNNEILYPLVAGGLILFGIFSLVAARYRIIPDVDSSRLKPRLAR